MAAVGLAASALAHPVVDGTQSAQAGSGYPANTTARGGTAAAAVELALEHLQPTIVADQHLIPSALSASDAELSDQGFGQAHSGIDAAVGAVGFERADPLFSVPRPAPGGKRNPAAPLPGGAPSGQTADAEPPEEVATVMRELRESVTQAMAAAFDARKDPEGRIAFSLAGIEGFHYSTQGEGLSLGYGDASLAMVHHGASATGQRPTTSRAVQRDPGSQDPDGARELIQFIKEIVQYPLVWLMIVLAVIGKATLLIANRPRKQRRRRSGSQQPANVQRTRTRKRVRFRIKHSLSRVGVQQH